MKDIDTYLSAGWSIARAKSTAYTWWISSGYPQLWWQPGPVFTDDFESSDNWDSLWTKDENWAQSDEKPYQGSYSAKIKGRVTDSALVSIAIDVADISEATITFWWLIESGLDAGEYLAFDVDTGSGWVTMAEFSGVAGIGDQEGVWINESINVDVSETNSLTLRFRGKMSMNNEVAYVDLVEVY